MALNLKKVKPLYLMPRKEKVREESFMTRKTKVEDLVLFQNKRRIRIFHTLSASNVINMDTVPVSVMVQIKGSMNPPLQMSMKTFLIRSQG